LHRNKIKSPSNFYKVLIIHIYYAREDSKGAYIVDMRGSDRLAKVNKIVYLNRS